jgi:hypothetical protein
MFRSCFDTPRVLDDIGLDATAPPADHATHDLITTKLCDFVLLLAANRIFSLSQHEVPHPRHTVFGSFVCFACGPRPRLVVSHRATLRNAGDCRTHIAVHWLDCWCSWQPAVQCMKAASVYDYTTRMSSCASTRSAHKCPCLFCTLFAHLQSLRMPSPLLHAGANRRATVDLQVLMP